MKRTLIYVALLFLIVTSAFAQRSTIKLEQKTNLPAIDGKCEDVLAGMLESNFTQLEPHIGVKSISRTKIICYQNDNSIYVGFACYQQVPIISNQQVWRGV